MHQMKIDGDKMTNIKETKKVVLLYVQAILVEAQWQAIFNHFAEQERDKLV